MKIKKRLKSVIFTSEGLFRSLNFQYLFKLHISTKDLICLNRIKTNESLSIKIVNISSNCLNVGF